MHFDINGAKIYSRNPSLIRPQAQPHYAAYDMSVNKDEKGVVHYLQQGLVFDGD